MGGYIRTPQRKKERKKKVNAIATCTPGEVFDTKLHVHAGIGMFLFALVFFSFLSWWVAFLGGWRGLVLRIWGGGFMAMGLAS